MRYGLKDLVDIGRLQELTDHLYAVAGIPSAIIAVDGEILTGSGWQRICTEFHRRHPEIERQCIESDTRLRERLGGGDAFVEYTCPRGLTDASIPIVIDGERLANAFVGQLFTQPPDAAVEARFRENAREFGLDENAYMDAFREIPVIGRDRLRPALLFLAQLARIVAESGLQRKRELEIAERLREGESRYRRLFESMDEGVAINEAVFDPSGRMIDAVILDVNPAYETLTTYRAGRAIGRRATELYSMTSVELAHWWSAKNGLRSATHSEYFHARSGRWFSIATTPLEADRFFTIFSDVTEQRRTLETLSASEEKYRLLAENISDAIWMLDLNERFTYLSPSTRSLWGYTPEEGFRLSMRETLTPESYEIAARTIAEEFAREGESGVDPNRSRLMELEQIHKDGTRYWTEVTAKFLRDANGSICGIIGATRDVSERRKSERALRESEALLRQAQDAAQLGHYVLNVTTGIWTCSEALEKVFGIAPDYPKSVEGWLEIVHPDDRDMMAVYFRDEVIGKRQRFDKLYRILRKTDHSTQWVHGQGDLSIGPDGAPVTMFGIIQNVTRDVEADQRAEQLQSQLQQAVKLEAVGRLAGGVAHDFNNLLTIIGGNADLLLASLPDGEAGREELAEIKKASERAAALTAQLLAFSRKQMIAPRVVDINELVTGSTKMLKRLIGEDVELSFVPGAVAGRIRVDPHQLEQVFVNLAVNARDAMPQGGRLRVETGIVVVDEEYARTHLDAAPGSYVRISISDTGAGIAPDLLPHLFEPFFTTKEVGKGTGLGLSMVYGIVRQNEGFIDVESERGVGSKFHVYLPLIEADRGPAPEPVSTPRPGGTETILLVEDEDPVRIVTRRFLQRLGYDVVDFSRAEDALDWAAGPDARFDLLLTDVIMPGMNGPQLHDALRAKRPELRVLYMSGYTGDAIARHGVLDETTDFLQKPFSLDLLAHSVRNALSGS